MGYVLNISILIHELFVSFSNLEIHSLINKR